MMNSLSGTSAQRVQGQLDDLQSNHFTIWRDPFNLSKLPHTITSELIKRTPFLLGSKKATYSKYFFKNIGGLCDAGIPFESLAKEDHGVPLADLVGTYPLNKSGNRHSMKLMTDRAAAQDALYMYQRVYGGTQPDNGEFGTAFIRGLVLYFQRDVEVNWAEHAADLAKKRLLNPGVNPQKLTPPCLREQIQEMLDIFQHYLRKSYMEKGSAVAQVKHHMMPPKHSAPPPSRKEVSVHNLGTSSSARTVRQQRSGGRFHPVLSAQAAVASPPSFAQSDPSATLKEKRGKLEEQLLRDMKKLDDAESKLKSFATKKLQLERSEEANWEFMVKIRANKKRPGLTPEEHKAIEQELWSKTSIASAIADESSQVSNQMAELHDLIDLLSKSTKE